MTSPVILTLRPVASSDLPIFFAQHRDPLARERAAFAGTEFTDRGAFDAHWQRILAVPGTTIRTVLDGSDVAGHIATFRRLGRPELGCWLGREFWGRGIATAAVAGFLPLVAVRPIYARTASDNLASIRVLEKSGFTLVAKERVYARARSATVDEWLYVLG